MIADAIAKIEVPEEKIALKHEIERKMEEMKTLRKEKHVCMRPSIRVTKPVYSIKSEEVHKEVQRFQERSNERMTFIKSL